MTQVPELSAIRNEVGTTMDNDSIRDVLRQLLSLETALRAAPSVPLGVFATWMLLDLDDRYYTYPEHDLSMLGDPTASIEKETARLVDAGYAVWDDCDEHDEGDLRLTVEGARAAQSIYDRFRESAAELGSLAKALEDQLDRLRGQ